MTLQVNSSVSILGNLVPRVLSRVEENPGNEVESLVGSASSMVLMVCLSPVGYGV